jgi:transglutaminase-like putative cysteine protease
MHYQIAHTTTYTYDQPVILQPHVLRLRPRCDGGQHLDHLLLKVVPEPAGVTQVIDAEGNAIARFWWSETMTRALSFHVTSEVETYCTNPFNYLLESWATHLPIDYPASLLSTLQPYLSDCLRPSVSGIDPIAAQLGQEIAQAMAGNTVAFLTELNQRIYQTCAYQLRETGEPLPPGITWTEKSGSCRDLTVLFMAACRAVGLAARFVSGYQEGDPGAQTWYLHAWAEVYLPGAGWRGYDPTLGLVVSDRHVALVASAWPRNAAPVSGTLQGKGAQSVINYHLSIQRGSEVRA